MAAHGVDLPLEGVDLGDGREVEMAAPDEGAEFGQERVAGLDVARDRPRLDEGRALPILPDGLVVFEGIGRGEGKRGRARIGPQPVIDPVDVAVRRALGQELSEILRDLAEHGLGLRPGDGLGARRVVEDDEVDIARIVELAPAELAEPEDEQPACPGGVIGIGEADPPPGGGPAQQRVEPGGDGGVGELRQGPRDRVEVPRSAEIGERHEERVGDPVGPEPLADGGEVGLAGARSPCRPLPGDEIGMGRLRRLLHEGDEPLRRPPRSATGTRNDPRGRGASPAGAASGTRRGRPARSPRAARGRGGTRPGESAAAAARAGCRPSA